MNRSYRKYILAALFTAVIAVSAQITFPLPSGTPVTLQTLAVALCAFLLGVKFSMLSTVIYLLLGLFGIPVFSFFSAGPAIIFGKNGGYLFGLLLVCVCCGMAKKMNNTILKYTVMAIGVILLHALGTVYFAAFFGTDILSSFLLSSMPLIAKDFLCVIIALFISRKIETKTSF